MNIESFKFFDKWQKLASDFIIFHLQSYSKRLVFKIAIFFLTIFNSLSMNPNFFFIKPLFLLICDKISDNLLRVAHINRLVDSCSVAHLHVLSKIST